MAGGYAMDLKANDFVEDEEAALAAGTDPEQLKVMPAMSPFEVDALILKVRSCASRLPIRLQLVTSCWRHWIGEWPWAWAAEGRGKHQVHVCPVPPTLHASSSS